MENKTCVACLKPKAQLSCDACKQAICKSCTEFLGEDSFSFLDKKTENILHRIYCRPCFEELVQPEMLSYNQIMEAAKDVIVYFKAQGKETRSFSRKENLFHVTNCADHDEAILRLAFLAAKNKFNAIIDVELSSKKERNGSYQRLLWSATARPTKIS